MTRRHGTAQFVAGLRALPLVAAMGVGLSGCGTVDLFGQYDIPESTDVAAAPWPRLVDVPEAPPVGEYTDAVPNPVEGAMAQADLGAASTAASARAAELAGTDTGAGQPGAGMIAAANARAAALSRPVISPAEREAMLARARQTR